MCCGFSNNIEPLLKKLKIIHIQYDDTVIFYMKHTLLLINIHIHSCLKFFEKENFHLLEILDASFSIKDANLRICHLSTFSIMFLGDSISKLILSNAAYVSNMYHLISILYQFYFRHLRRWDTRCNGNESQFAQMKIYTYAISNDKLKI